MKIAFVKATKSTHEIGRLKRHHNNNIIRCFTSKKTKFLFGQSKQTVYCSILCLHFICCCVLIWPKKKTKKDSQLKCSNIEEALYQLICFIKNGCTGGKAGSSQCLGTKTARSHKRQFHRAQRRRTVAARGKSGKWHTKICNSIQLISFEKSKQTN